MTNKPPVNPHKGQDAKGRYTFGNKFGELQANLKTKQDKHEAVIAYCDHVRQGKIKHSFFWKSPRNPQSYATYQTIRNVLEKGECARLTPLLYEAECQNLDFWDTLGRKIATGEQRGEGWVWANNMFNRFKNKLGWRLSDKNEPVVETDEAKAERGKLAEIVDSINKK